MHSDCEDLPLNCVQLLYYASWLVLYQISTHEWTFVHMKYVFGIWRIIACLEVAVCPKSFVLVAFASSTGLFEFPCEYPAQNARQALDPLQVKMFNLIELITYVKIIIRRKLFIPYKLNTDACSVLKDS